MWTRSKNRLLFSFAVTLLLVGHVFAEEDEIDEEESVPHSVRVESCAGWRLNKLPEVKKFIQVKILHLIYWWWQWLWSYFSILLKLVITYIFILINIGRSRNSVSQHWVQKDPWKVTNNDFLQPARGGAWTNGYFEFSTFWISCLIRQKGNRKKSSQRKKLQRRIIMKFFE